MIQILPKWQGLRLLLTTFFTLFALCFISLQNECRAEWTVVPTSMYQLYETYGLFVDEQSTLIWTGSSKFWGALGGTIPLYGNPESETHPEIVLHASANAAMHINEGNRIWTETVDARVGFSYEFEPYKDLRFSLGWAHYSGHAADGILDSELISPDMGDNLLRLRVIRDYQNTFRFGCTLKPFLFSQPQMVTFASDQFAEWFPWGASRSASHASPFVALSFEEYGVDHLTLSFHVQAGAYFGNHFRSELAQSLRPVIGYYRGLDPRLKYASFQNSHSQFAYFGVMLDL